MYLFIVYLQHADTDLILRVWCLVSVDSFKQLLTAHWNNSCKTELPTPMFFLSDKILILTMRNKEQVMVILKCHDQFYQFTNLLLIIDEHSVTFVSTEANHWVGLACSSLTISKQCTVVPFPGIVQHALTKVFKYLLLPESNYVVNIIMLSIITCLVCIFWRGGLKVSRSFIKTIMWPVAVVKCKSFGLRWWVAWITQICGVILHLHNELGIPVHLSLVVYIVIKDHLAQNRQIIRQLQGYEWPYTHSNLDVFRHYSHVFRT